MNKEQKMLGYYNHTVILTYIGMLTGFTGIIYSFDGDAVKAMICLMIAGFCDMFDGAIASTRERTCDEKYFGIQIDSLSDLVCFGVLPAAIVLNLNRQKGMVTGISAVYVLCALIRLAYFNVDEQNRQRESTASREIYYGMPVTLSALLLPFLYGLLCLFPRSSNASLAVLLFVMAVLFLMPFPLKKPKIVGKLCVLLCGVAEILLVTFACVLN